MAVTPTILSILPQITQGNAPVSVLLVAAPAGLAGRVQGEVANIDKSGQVVIQTPDGDVIIKTDLPLKIGQSVDIKLPTQVSGAAAQTAQLSLATAPMPHPEELTALPPSVLLEVAENAQTAGGLPPQVSAGLPGYQAPSAIPPAQTLFELMGLNLAATVMPPAAGPKAPAEGSLGMLGLLAGMNPLNTMAASKAAPQPPAMMALDRVQILFIGSLDDAQNALERALPSLGKPAAGNAAAQGTAPNVPVLAQLTGLTPQKLPIFEALPLPPGIQAPTAPASPVFAGGEKADGVQTGAHIVLHAPVLMTMAEEKQAGPVAALLVKLPPVPMTPEEMFAETALARSAPTLTQLLQTPSSMVPTAMIAQVHDMVPRPGTPKFAMNVAMALMGLSGGDASHIFGAKLLAALKPEHRAALEKEIQALPTLTREGAGSPEGMRINLPVEMAGQMYMWQLTVRNHDADQRQSAGGGRVDAPTRFILDLYMTQLGAMQVDGLSFHNTRRLDLILRTKDAFTPDVQNALRQEAYTVFERAELSGSFEFQTF